MEEAWCVTPPAAIGNIGTALAAVLLAALAGWLESRATRAARTPTPFIPWMLLFHVIGGMTVAALAIVGLFQCGFTSVFPV